MSGVQFTRDGTYLRYKAATSEIEFPDGTVHHFLPSGFPDAIHDRFINQITIDYGVSNLWTISDGFRTQKVWFRNVPVNTPPLVDRIELTAFGTSVPAVWKFHYNTDDAISYKVTGCKNTDPLKVDQPVTVLTQMLLPDGSTYKMAAADYGTQFNPSCDAGMLKGMTLPTLGRVEWDYMQYTFPSSSSPRTFRQTSTGVGARRLKDASSGLIGQWAYSTALTQDPNFSQPQELVNSVVTPLGHKAVRGGL